jgi:RPA family protein
MPRKNQNHALVPACRVFFSEILKSDLFVPEHGKTFLVTPTGARCARLYGVAELKGVEQRGTIFRVIVNDSTASLHIYTDKALQPRLEQTAGEKRTFIAFNGTVLVREGAEMRRLIILAEEIGAVEEHVRKSWILATAWQTLERIEKLRIIRSVKKNDVAKKEESTILDLALIPEVLEHYALDDEKLDALASTAINAVKSVWQQYHTTTREQIEELVKHAGKRGMEREKILGTLKTKGLPEEWINDLIDELIIEGRCYESISGVLTI